MTKKAKSILEQALKLSPSERAEILDGLATSLDADAFPLHPAWREEIERRVERILSGEAKGIPIARAIKTLRRAQERDERSRGKASSR